MELPPVDSSAGIPSTVSMILHVDMDAFYASVEQRDDPSLKGKPVVVGGPAAGRGVVSAANYEARKYGIHSAMPSATARRLCPHAVFLPSRMSHYAEISKSIREIFYRYTPLVEPLSLDEAFLDVTGSLRLFGPAEQIGRQIKQQILNEVGLVASVGLAPNKFLAKLASDVDKPDGFVVVASDKVQSFLDPLDVRRLWGVGRVTAKGFDRLGVRTILQLRKLPLDLLQSIFGDQAKHLWNLARGIDDRSVVPDRQAKSISHETTFPEDVRDETVLSAWMLELADQVGRRLRRNELLGRTVQLKIRFQDFRTVTRAITLPRPTDTTQEIYDAACELLQRLQITSPVRLVGVGLSGFGKEDGRQKMLFDEEEHETQKNADHATDEIRNRFGHSALSRGSRLLHETRRNAAPTTHDIQDKDEPA